MVELLDNDIKSMIYVVRGQQVMLDSDLAMLYGYETKNNAEKFEGEDFMFRLSFEEARKLPRSQFVTLEGKGNNVVTKKDMNDIKFK